MSYADAAAKGPKQSPEEVSTPLNALARESRVAAGREL